MILSFRIYIPEQALGQHIIHPHIVSATAMINKQRLIQNSQYPLTNIASTQPGISSPLLQTKDLTPPLFRLQLRMMHRPCPRPLNPLHHRRRPIRANLREPAHLPRVKPQRNHRVAPAALRLGHDAADGVVSRRVQLHHNPSASPLFHSIGKGEDEPNS